MGDVIIYMPKGAPSPLVLGPFSTRERARAEALILALPADSYWITELTPLEEFAIMLDVVRS